MTISALLNGLWLWAVIVSMIVGPITFLFFIIGLIIGFFRESIFWWFAWCGGAGFVVGCRDW